MTHSTGPSRERLRRYWDKSAKSYDREMAFLERLLFEGAREWACGQASGDVLEVAIGTGRNLPFYQPDVRLTGIEFSPAMLELARERASALDRQVDLHLGDAQALDLPDSAFDTVLCTLSLCAIPDERRAIAEVHRVLRPGGRFLVLEHVRSPIAIVRAGQRLLDPLMARMACDYLLRDPLDHLGAAGFQIERCERTKLGIIERLVARKLM